MRTNRDLNIINPNASGDLYYATIWGGQGYTIKEYYAYANNIDEAIDVIFEYAYQNGDGTVFSEDEVEAWCREDYKVNEWSANYRSYEDFEYDWMADFAYNSDGTLLAFRENFFITDVTPEMMED